jgi:hypothetical protein
VKHQTLALAIPFRLLDGVSLLGILSDPTRHCAVFGGRIEILEVDELAAHDLGSMAYYNKDGATRRMRVPSVPSFLAPAV